MPAEARPAFAPFELECDDFAKVFAELEPGFAKTFMTAFSRGPCPTSRRARTIERIGRAAMMRTGAQAIHRSFSSRTDWDVIFNRHSWSSVLGA